MNIPARPYALIKETKLPSVTTVLNELAKPGLSWAAARETARFAVLHPGTWMHLADEQAIDKLYRHHSGIWTSRAAMGTLMHRFMQHLADGKDLTPETVDILTRTAMHTTKDCRLWWNEPYDKTHERVLGYVNGLEQFWQDYSPQGIASEVVVRHPRKYIGTADLYATLSDSPLYSLLDLKGLSLDTPLPTPTGWTTMGSVRVGDYLLDKNGQPCQCIVKSAISYKFCYRISFDDGSSVICDDDHLWAVYHVDVPHLEKLMTASEISMDLHGRVSRGYQRKLAVRNGEPLDLPPANLVVDPYLLGAWLGDGTRCDTRIADFTVGHVVAQAFRDAGFSVKSHPKGTHFIKGFRGPMRAAGLMGVCGDVSDRWNKHIPSEYLRGNVDQRLSLLQGLMDTDGSWNQGRKQAVFTNTTPGLAEGVFELVVSLGERPSRNHHEASGFGRVVRAYTVSWTPSHFNPFLRVEHKRSGAEKRLRSLGATHSGRRMITSVTSVPVVPTQCVMVNSPSHTYLCGDTMVPTHNTTAQQTDSKGFYADGYSLQLHAYAYATERVHYDIDNGQIVEAGTKSCPHPQRLAVLHLRGNTSYDLWEIPKDEEVYLRFLGLLDLYHWRKSVSKSARKLQKAGIM